jgi:WD40 repeat protein
VCEASGKGDLCLRPAEVHLYDVSKNQLIRTWTQESNWPILSLAYSLDGKSLASGTLDGRILLWDASASDASGVPFIGEEIEAITALAYSPDGTMLASGNQRGSLALWDIASRQQTGRTIRAGGRPLSGLLFSGDGFGLISAALDGGIQRWDLDPQSWIERLCSLAGPNLTLEEHQLLLSAGIHDPTCPGLTQPNSTPTP